MVAVYDIAQLKQRVASREWRLGSFEREERGRNAQLLEVLEAVERTLVQNQRHIRHLEKENGLALKEFKRLKDLLPEMRIDPSNPLRRIFHPKSVAARRELVERLETVTSAINAASRGRRDRCSVEQDNPAGLHRRTGKAFLVAAIVSLMMVAVFLAKNLFGESIDDVLGGTPLHRHFADVLIENGNQGAISQRLEFAQRQMARLRLTTPAGDNAYETYQQILSIDPHNQRALEGVKQIGDKYLELANRAATKGDLQQSDLYAKLASKLAAQHQQEATPAVPAEAAPEANGTANSPVANSHDSVANPHDAMGLARMATTRKGFTVTAHSAAPKSSTERPRELVADYVPDQGKPHDQRVDNRGFEFRPPSDLAYPWEPPGQTVVVNDLRRSHDHDLPPERVEGVGGQSLASSGRASSHADGSSAASGSGSGGSSPGDKDTGKGKGKGKGTGKDSGQGKGAGKGGNTGGGKGNGRGKNKG